MLIPRPRINLVLYHGVPAPNSGWRARVVTDLRRATGGRKPVLRGERHVEIGTSPLGVGRAFDLDVLACQRCGGGHS